MNYLLSVYKYFQSVAVFVLAWIFLCDFYLNVLDLIMVVIILVVFFFDIVVIIVVVVCF